MASLLWVKAWLSAISESEFLMTAFVGLKDSDLRYSTKVSPQEILSKIMKIISKMDKRDVDFIEFDLEFNLIIIKNLLDWHLLFRFRIFPFMSLLESFSSTHTNIGAYFLLSLQFLLYPEKDSQISFFGAAIRITIYIRILLSYKCYRITLRILWAEYRENSPGKYCSEWPKNFDLICKERKPENWNYPHFLNHVSLFSGVKFFFFSSSYLWYA